MTMKRRRIWIHGITGRMGQTLADQLKDHRDFELVGGSSSSSFQLVESSSLTLQKEDFSKAFQRTDVILDFSSPQGTRHLCRVLEKMSAPQPAVLLATTGLTEVELKAWHTLASQSSLRLLEAPNTSLGILLLNILIKEAASLLAPAGFDVEIEETHHRNKKDSPSGTAKLLAKTLAAATHGEIVIGREGVRRAQEIGVTSMRGGGVAGEHKVRFLGDFEELSISHRAFSRALFAQGALILAKWLLRREPGFYQLSDVTIAELLKK